MGKVVFFDIDGTLYDFEGKMPASAGIALKMLRKNGHQTVVCSGRAKHQLYPELLSLMDGFVLLNGAYVEKDNVPLYSHILSEKTVRKIKKVLGLAEAEFAAMKMDGLWLSESCVKIYKERFGSISEEMQSLVMGDYKIIPVIDEKDSYYKVLFENSSEAWPVERISEALSDCCDVTASSFKDIGGSGEISEKDINKALGMKKYLESQGFKREDSICFGDGPNDTDMMKYAHISIAMGNAKAEIKKLSSMVTSSVNEDGIFQALKKLGLI